MMNLMKSMMIGCRKATFLLSKKEEGKISLWERFHLAWHLFTCDLCTAFAKQSAYIAKQARNFISAAALSSEDKSRILKSLGK